MGMQPAVEMDECQNKRADKLTVSEHTGAWASTWEGAWQIMC